MTAPPRPSVRVALQWVAAIMFVLTSLAFVSEQVQQPGASFTTPPQRSLTTEDEVAAPAQLTYDEVVASYGDAKVVRLPGAVATFDESVVLPLLEGYGARQIVLAPPLNDGGQEMEVPSDVVIVTGTSVSLFPFTTAATTMDSFRGAFEYGDVTGDILTLVAETSDDEQLLAQDEDYAFSPRTREPTADEAAAVIADLQDDGMAFVGGATPFARPELNPFSAEPLFVVAPATAAGESSVDYRDAVAAAFPGRPVVTMRGLWVEFSSPETDEIAPAITASFYGRFESRLASYAYSQDAVVAVMLGRVEAFRNSGMFDREIPYVPADPLHVAAPWLPWLAGGFAVVAVGASLRPRRKTDKIVAVAEPTRIDPTLLTRLAGLADLSVAMSSLVFGDAKPRFARATAALSIARDGVARGDLPADELTEILDRVEDDLTEVSAKNKLDSLKPDVYLRSVVDP